ncbi:hypothetical protein HYZ06_00150 [Candidatus Daviesbacteria bacterium]|nr:hypothetical protein [Candidatus Daviesbacteria bacterium]
MPEKGKKEPPAISTVGFTPKGRELLTNGLGSDSFAQRLQATSGMVERAEIYRDELYRVMGILDSARSRLLDTALSGAFALARLEVETSASIRVGGVSGFVLRELKIQESEEGAVYINLPEAARKGLEEMARYQERVGEAEGRLDAVRSIWDVLWLGSELDQLLRKSPLLRGTPDSSH